MLILINVGFITNALKNASIAEGLIFSRLFLIKLCRRIVLMSKPFDFGIKGLHLKRMMKIRSII